MPEQRTGVFIDGGFYHYLNAHLFETPPHRTLNLLGQVDLAERDHGPAIERHYVKGRIGTVNTPLNAALETAGFTRHDVPILRGREIGADVTLALLAYSKAQERSLDVVYLLTADGDLSPVPHMLAKIGVATIIPRVALGSPQDGLYTSLLLQETPAQTPDLFELAAQADLSPDAHALLARTEKTTTIGVRQVSGSRRGVIAYLDPEERFAFITDRLGQSWYMPSHPLRGEERDAPMQIGVEVEFHGSPYPEPGHKYPRARTVKAKKESSPPEPGS